MLSDFLGGLFNGRTHSDEPERGATGGSGDVLGAERIAGREISRR
jgi:hypothetical protein